MEINDLVRWYWIGWAVTGIAYISLPPWNKRDVITATILGIVWPLAALYYAISITCGVIVYIGLDSLQRAKAYRDAQLSEQDQGK